MIMLILTAMSTAVAGATGATAEEMRMDSLVRIVDKVEGAEQTKIYNELCWGLRYVDAEQAVEYGQKALESATRSDDYLEAAKSYSYLGICYRNLGDYDDAFASYKKGLEIANRNNLRDQIAYSHIDIGNIYLHHKNYTQADQELKTALGVAKQLGDQEILGFCYINLGRVCMAQNKLDDAEDYLNKCLDIRERNKMDRSLIAVVEKEIGDLAMKRKEYDRAIEYYRKATDERDGKIRDVALAAGATENMTRCYGEKEQWDSAAIYANKCLEYSERQGNSYSINRAHRLMGRIYEKQGDYAKAIESYDVVLAYSDTMMSKEIETRLDNMEYRFEKMKKERELERVKKDQEIRNAYMMVGVVFIVMMVGLVIVLVRRNVEHKKTNKILKAQKEEIEEQKGEIEHQNRDLAAQKKEITDSIEYAKRIQFALLPNSETIKKYFKDGFIFYKPRNVVSGDYYWMADYEDYFALVAADCTGHGVPGAFMSLLGISALNEIVDRDGERNSGEIMNRLRQRVKTLLNQNARDPKSPQDGMDAALIVVDKRTGVLDFAGAYLSLLCLRGKEEITLKGTSNPKGVYVKEVPFVSQTLQLEKEDKIYLTSDGYWSQFGGPNNKKLNMKGYKEVITKNSGLPMEEQKEALEKYIAEWRGSVKQTDDMLVIGLEV